MKIATYLILGVVAVLTVCAMISAIMMALQVLIYAAAAALVIWAVIAVSTYLFKTEKPP